MTRRTVFCKQSSCRCAINLHTLRVLCC